METITRIFTHGVFLDGGAVVALLSFILTLVFITALPLILCGKRGLDIYFSGLQVVDKNEPVAGTMVYTIEGDSCRDDGAEFDRMIVTFVNVDKDIEFFNVDECVDVSLAFYAVKKTEA